MQDAASVLEVQLVVLADGHHGQRAGKSAFLIFVPIMEPCMNQVRVFRINRILFERIECMELFALNAFSIKGTVAVKILPYFLLIAEDAD